MREFTEQEQQQIFEAERELRESGLDVDHENATHNANLILNYFDRNLNLPVTKASIYKFIEANKQQFAWLSSARREYEKVAASNPTAAAALTNWLQTQKKLVNTGDEGFENASLILGALQGREATWQNISHAEDRILHNPGRQLVYIAQPRRTEPVSAAAKADDGTPFLSGNLVKNADGSFRSKTPAEQARDREAAERQSQPTRQAEPDAWETLCIQLCNYGSRHSQKAAMKETFDRGVANGKSFREIYGEMNQLRKQYEFSHAPLAPSVNRS